MSYDAKCLELAHHFLRDVPGLSDEQRGVHARKLAVRIQLTVEDELADQQLRTTHDEAFGDTLLADVLQVIEKLDGGERGLTARDIVKRLFDCEWSPSVHLAREAIHLVTRGSLGTRPDPVRLGTYLAKNRGRVVSGRAVERRLWDDNVMHWAIRRQPDAAEVARR